MKIKPNSHHMPYILRFFIGITVFFWGYEKLILEKLAKTYVMDYGPFMFFDVNTFLLICGALQIVAAVMVILGAFTRFNAIAFVLMGLITIVIPGFVVMKDVPHFAYAFAFTGAALALFITGSGAYSVDSYLQRYRMARAGGRIRQAGAGASRVRIENV